ncbi:hypothetical protein OHA79_45565 (plasmid) [Streptomyces sp. NBC_00841]|uniref:hypothetical protein n=1 Tax=unclassified Streptomyces TaxID=2593676 RepID=UPI002250F79B|nr:MULTISPECIES: hypothetical protein [unclassified Streptomyces]MCX4538249.1 hypothetical protein [Streptomyces sp. NBC_01669]MCX4538931.1 hypothetical protein [Streptomyces sp. NBC_01669]WSA04763.1 hypothetical protein OHA79_44590 [Streptomyces sp. NBC_00841]WSA04831.1 hypothetical protein OHA79_45000 [Streptomyces sp. NBC_00841]WSA04837.1 hypothetical protein OHA79_45050 [Streptomyces sp. NBC_00841]
MPSVLGLMERREARARQDLESWTEVLEQAQVEVDAARERVERARVGREELVSVLAEESTVDTPVSVPSGGGVATAAGSSGSGAGHGERPPAWRSGMGEEVLSGVYREVFAAVVAAPGPVNGVELTRAVGREAEVKNEVEKIRHRAYVLEKRGWLVRADDGRFTPAPGAVARAACPASVERPRPGAGTA